MSQVLTTRWKGSFEMIEDTRHASYIEFGYVVDKALSILDIYPLATVESAREYEVQICY